MAIKDLNVNDDLFHSLVHDYKQSIYTLDSILTDGGIIPPSIRKTNRRYGCNKPEEVCISRKTANIFNVNLFVSCFDLYLNRLVTIIIDKKFSKEFTIYKPKLITTNELIQNTDLVNSGSYTNLYDEYRTKDIIPVEYFKGVSLPIDALVEDPVTFFTFLVEAAMIEYYNFGLDDALVKK